MQNRKLAHRLWKPQVSCDRLVRSGVNDLIRSRSEDNWQIDLPAGQRIEVRRHLEAEENGSTVSLWRKTRPIRGGLKSGRGRQGARYSARINKPFPCARALRDSNLPLKRAGVFLRTRRDDTSKPQQRSGSRGMNADRADDAEDIRITRAGRSGAIPARSGAVSRVVLVVRSWVTSE